MAIQASISTKEQDRAQLKELQRAVLSYLSEHGSAKWGALYGVQDTVRAFAA